ncbi:hypothetical protein [Methanocella conradii]|uniref:hypothetical protein n=1 Tax=Methanocella conradii TaxID=1175444 RepID=UPI0024B35747|nr:hypothetical protein [Methanocella conradii]MDI6897305.1 hypothetical protein [Methanocella conradii]
MDMRAVRIMALLSMVVVLSGAAIAAPGSAMQASDNGNASSGSLPLYFIIDSTLGAHEQDIKDGIFEYEFEAARNDPALQASLIQKRCDELKSEVKNRKELLSALLLRDGVMRGDQLVAVAEEMNASIEKLDGRSRKLDGRAAGLGAANDKKAYEDSIIPLMSDLSNAQGMVATISQKANNKGPSGNGNGNRR